MVRVGVTCLNGIAIIFNSIKCLKGGGGGGGGRRLLLRCRIPYNDSLNGGEEWNTFYQRESSRLRDFDMIEIRGRGIKIKVSRQHNLVEMTTCVDQLFRY